MSAHKRTTITISEEEYRKLHEAEMKKRFVEKELPALKNELQRETQFAVQQGLEALDQRQHSFVRMMDGFQDEIRYSEMATQNMLRSQQEELLRSLEDYSGQMWSDFSEELSTHWGELSGLLHQEHEQRQVELRQLETDLSSLADEQERRREMAQNWLEFATDLHHFIAETYDHQKFAPGELQVLENKLIRAEQNFQDDIPEAALIAAQDCYAALSDLRIKLEEKWSEWQTQYVAVLEHTRSLRWITQESTNVKAVDLEGNELEQNIEVDFWTQGKLSELNQYLSGLVEQLEQNSAMLDMNNLKELLQETLPVLNEQLFDLVTDARIKVINSQLRINIADIVLQALQEQGFSYQESGYLDGDMRTTFLASAKNLAGSEVIIQVEPAEGTDGRNELHLHSHDLELRTNSELRQRAREINQTLSRHGLQVGTTSTQPVVEENLMQYVVPLENIKNIQRQRSE